jgi:hypothetical protein
MGLESVGGWEVFKILDPDGPGSAAKPGAEPVKRASDAAYMDRR